MTWIHRDEHTAGVGQELVEMIYDEGYSIEEQAGIIVDASVVLAKVATPSGGDPEDYLEDIIDAMRDALGG